MSDIIENVKLDDIKISDLCTGTIRVSADIKPLNDDLDKKSQSTSISFSHSEYNTFGITISPGNTTPYYLDIDSSDEQRYIPARYTNGVVNVTIHIARSDDPDNAVDLTVDLLMFIDDKPEWYPYNLNLRNAVPSDEWYSDCPNKKGMSYAIGDIINSPSVNKRVPEMSPGHPETFSFNIGTWQGIPPVVPRIVDGKWRGCLPKIKFRLYIRNNLDYNAILSAIVVESTFNYDAYGTLVNLGSSDATKVHELHCGPYKLGGDSDLYSTGGAPENVSGDSRHLWAIVDGYEKGSSEDLDELIKVYGYYKKYNGSKYETDDVVVLKPVESTGGSNYLPVIYKSDNAVISKFNNNRMIVKGMDSSLEYVWPVTQEEICHGDRFKKINVECKDDKGRPCSPSDEKARFIISIDLRDTIRECKVKDGLTKDEFHKAIGKIRYYNVERDYEYEVEDE